MLIKMGTLIDQASGSVNGVTFSHNRFGAYVRNRAIPVNPQSSRQTTVRTIIQTLTNLWSGTLTAVQRAQWATYAENVPVINKLGDTVYLTGLNHYIRSNLPRLVVGLARVDAGPTEMTLPETDATAAATYTADDQKMVVEFNDELGWCDLDGAAMLCYQGSPRGIGTEFFNGPFRLVDSIDGDSVTPPTSTSELDSAYVLQEGVKVYHRFRISLDDGRLSSFFRLGNAIVAAS